MATEAIRAAVGYGFDNLKLKRMEAWIHPENIDSIKTAGRVGFTYRGRRRIKFVNASVPHDLLVYGLEVSEWFHVAGPLVSSDGDQNFYGLRIVLPVRNIDETIKFYREKLGFELEYCHGDPPEEAGVSKGQWSSDALKVHFVANEEETRPSGYLYFVVGADIDGLFENYRKQDVQIDFEPRMTIVGGREFQIVDPNGHKLRFGTL
jgi:catechol 2,3-dioxygenase-like lactoylglutathione lyase family enzyme